MDLWRVSRDATNAQRPSRRGGIHHGGAIHRRRCPRGRSGRYRDCFYWPMRGWNLLGDNTRFYAIGVLAWLHRLDLFFIFILVPMNLALIALWLWQRRADRRFLDSV